MATYCLDGEGYEGTASVDWPAYSDDNGVTWKFGDPFSWIDGKPTNVATSVKKGDHFKYNYGFCFGATVLKSGRIIAQESAIRRTAPGVFTGHGVSSDDGLNWIGPFDIHYDVPTNTLDTCYLSSRAVELSDGSIICIGWCGWRGEKGLATFAFRSTDGGQSYSFLSMVAGPRDAPWGVAVDIWGTGGPQEPAIEILPDGSLICMMRTGTSTTTSSRMLIARSSDGGRTWKHEKCPFPGVMPKLYRMSNGVLVCAFGRPGNNLIFSLDGGHTWGHETAITPADVSSSGYLDLVETEPGRLFVVYDALNCTLSQFWLWEPGDMLNGIFGVFVDVKRW